MATKPETEIVKTQRPAMGDTADNQNTQTDVEKEASSIVASVTPVGGHGQGGSGH